MNRSHIAAVALAACCATAFLPASAADWQKSDWVSVVNQASVTLAQAIGKATAATGGRAIEAEFKTAKWGTASGWEVELITTNGMKTEVWVDAQSGQVGQQRSKPAKVKYADRLAAASLSIEQAIEAAKAQVEGRAISAELEQHRSGVVFEIKVLRADGAVQRVIISAADGSVQSLLPSTAVSLQQAIAAALETAPGYALEAELETDGKYGLPPFYEVEVLTDNGMKTKLRIDAQSGQVSVYKNKPAKGKDRARLDAAALSLAQAIDAAVAHSDGAQALEADLDTWRGRVSYEVKLLQGDVVQKLVIDARDGAVLHQRWDD